MLGFAPVSTHPLGQIETRYSVGVDNISVGISVVEMPVSYVYNFDSPDNLSVPITLGDVRFTWDFQEKLSEQWTDQNRLSVIWTDAAESNKVWNNVS